MAYCVDECGYDDAPVMIIATNYWHTAPVPKQRLSPTPK